MRQYVCCLARLTSQQVVHAIDCLFNSLFVIEQALLINAAAWRSDVGPNRGLGRKAEDILCGRVQVCTVNL